MAATSRPARGDPHATARIRSSTFGAWTQVTRQWTSISPHCGAPSIRQRVGAKKEARLYEWRGV
jgi:hypothetical protein